MNGEKWKQYGQTICVVYTCLVMWKVIAEALKGANDVQYGKNLFLMFLITCFATVVIHSYKKLQRFPLLPVIIGQYALVIAVVLGGVFFAEKAGFTEVAATGYRDLFLSVTVPYGVGAVIYYIAFFKDIRKANRMIQEIRERER